MPKATKRQRIPKVTTQQPADPVDGTALLRAAGVLAEGLVRMTEPIRPLVAAVDRAFEREEGSQIALLARVLPGHVLGALHSLASDLAAIAATGRAIADRHLERMRAEDDRRAEIERKFRQVGASQRERADAQEHRDEAEVARG